MEDYIPHQRLRLLAARIHRLGPRPLYEVLVELQAGAPLVPRLERYALLPGDFISALGGDQLPRPRIVAARRDRVTQPESTAAE
jgi:hypothetical protein